MANTFLRKVSSNVSTVETAVGGYTSTNGAVVIGLSISNTTASQVFANVSINNGITSHYIVRNVTIPAQSSVVAVGDNQKIILQTNDSVKVSASANVDVIMNIMESDTIGVSTDPVSYSVTANVNGVNENQAIGYTITTQNVADNTTLYWQLIGNVVAADFSDTVTSGNVTISNSSATVVRPLYEDLTTEGPEWVQLKVYTDASYVNLVASSGNVTVTDSSTNPPPLNQAYYAGAYFPGITSSTPVNSQKNSFTLLSNIATISANVGASSASSYHFTYIKDDDQSWRYYAPNGLTIGTTGNYTVVQVGSGTWKYVHVAFDSGHMFGIKTSGELYACGDNNNGQLGIGNTTNKSYSQVTQVGSATNWTKVCGAKYASIGLRSDGTIWTWGLNSGDQAGQLGVGGSTDVTSPTQVGSATHWVDIAAAPSYGTVFYALKNDGTLWYWGDASYGGGLGQGDTLVTTPTQIGSASNWAKIYGAYRSLRAIKTNGTLWGGYNASSPYGGSFQQVGSDTDWSITAGATFNWHAIKTNGTLWAISVYNFYGSAGTGNTTDVLTPTQIGSDTNWRNLAPTSQYYGTVAIK